MRNIAMYDSVLSSGKVDKLCEKGFFIIKDTTDCRLPEFVEKWKVNILNGFSFYIHPRQSLYFVNHNNTLYFLIGHAYNPFTLSFNEQEIINEWIACEEKSNDAANEYINSITGIYIMGKINDDNISIILDCAGMMSGFYGAFCNNIIISSHTVIASEIFNLEKSKYVQELLKYRFYHLYGCFLPGDITPYENFYRIIPNTEVIIDLKTFKSTIKRFYPCKNIEMVQTEDEYNAQIASIAKIFQQSMDIIAQKWERPAISLTGGMDSKTTLAATNGNYDKFKYFSYITSNAEKIDANAAHNICEAIGVTHKIYEISHCPSDFEKFDVVKDILQYNIDYLGKNNVNDICKRYYFDNIDDFDVEVKSWVSEIARANYYKKFGKKKMPKHITPRRCSSMYKIFLHNRSLLKKTDKIFKDYIKKTKLEDNLYNLDWSDLFLWEIRYGSWGGLVITSEHKYSFDITIPYNNRKLLELMLSVPLEKRRKDILHQDLIKYMNSKISDTGINIINLNETKFREICEKTYFNINTHLPF